ncbi:MAG: MarR family winged helix-turn-helix transcriptional regulator, partial [Bacteroidales bacterium]|nr:MarR family winged helix-turn-helix transcriptional regulator [Bacteroidales bacterium]
VSIIHRYSHVYFKKQFLKYNLGYGQIPILMFIAKNKDVSLKVITENFKLDKGTTSSLVQKLEMNDYITKNKNTNDKREFNLCITDKASKIVPEIRQSRMKWTEILLKDFSDNEKDLTFEFLNKMVNNVEFLKK